VRQQGYLILEWEQMAPDIRLAGVKVSVTTVMLTELMSPSQYDACSVCNNEINGRVAGQGTTQCLNDVSKDLLIPTNKILSSFLMIWNHTFSSGVYQIHLS